MIVFTSCTAQKMDSIPIPPGSVTIHSHDYVKDKNQLLELNQIRKQIFNDPRAKIGSETTYAFDLYVNTGNAYKDLKRNHYQKIKSLLISKKLD